MNEVNIIKDLCEVSTLMSEKHLLSAISTRMYNGEVDSLKTFDDDSLQKIADFMPTIYEKMNAFGRKNTNATNKLMTLTMMTDGHPYRTLRQCLAQIESTRTAIRENIKRLKESQNKATYYLAQNNVYTARLQGETDELEIATLNYKIGQNQIRLESAAITITESRVYIEGALKEIASFQDAYQQILKNNNIPEDWTEHDFEEQECGFHVRQGFLHAYRDIKAHNKLGMGTLEYLQQFGVFPDMAEYEVHLFSQDLISHFESNPDTDITFLYEWLDRMEEKYGNEYKKAMKKMGLDSLSKNWYLYKGMVDEA